MTEAGPSAKRPPHIALEAGLRALIVCLPLVAVTMLSACSKDAAAPPQPAQNAAAPAPAAPPAGGEASGTLDVSKRGSAMPTDAFTAPGGKSVTLADFKGKPLLVNLWATWCGPCVKEMPMLDRLAARTEGRLKVLTISQDASDQPTDPVPAWWAKAGLKNLEQYRDGANNLGFAFGGGQLPTTVLYDAQGREVWRFVGYLDWEGARAAELLRQAGV